MLLGLFPEKALRSALGLVLVISLDLVHVHVELTILRAQISEGSKVSWY